MSRQEVHKIAQFVLDEIADSSKGKLTLRGIIRILQEAISALEYEALSVHAEDFLQDYEKEGAHERGTS